MLRLITLSLLVGWFNLVAFADQSDVSVVRWSGSTMGTTYTVSIVDVDSSYDSRRLQILVDAELRRVNDEMSTYIESSEISRFNASESTDWIEVSNNFATVVNNALEIAAKTDGAFDPTVGPLVDAWNFGAAERTGKPPSDEAIAMAKQRVGYRQIKVREAPPALRKLRADTEVDLSAIAKGHGADRVIDVLVQNGIENCFVEIGGEVATRGDKGGRWWKVGIQVPEATADQVMLAYPLSTDASDVAMATSGDYRNYVEIDGERYSHTIDPRTGRPVTHDLTSVSVVAANCMTADAWATALNVVGMQNGIALAKSEGLEVMLIERSGDGYRRRRLVV